MVVAENAEQAALEFAKKFGVEDPVLKPDEDVLDTWFSSWLWPIQVFKGFTEPGNKEIKYYYPGSVLVTGQDIIFFWVARMAMAGFEYEHQKPFEHVYFTGMVRDKQGRKMSKTLGNSPDLLQLIDKYGADAVRFGIMIAAPAGNDLLFDEASLEQGRFFNNKLWNALKLVKMWESRISDSAATDDSAQQFAINWFENRLSEVRSEVETMLAQFRLSEALKTVYSLIWDDFCSWYLEWVKPGYEQPVSKLVYEKTVSFFADLMQLLHPFMPFITEEIYHLLEDKKDDLCVKQFADVAASDKSVLDSGLHLKTVITAIRDARNKAQLKPKEEIEVYIQAANKTVYQPIKVLLAKQVNAKSIEFAEEQVPASIAVVAGRDKFYLKTDQPCRPAILRKSCRKSLSI